MMNKVFVSPVTGVIIQTDPKMVPFKKNVNFHGKNKNLHYTSEIVEQNNRVMIKSNVTWYDTKQKKYISKKYLHIFECDDYEMPKNVTDKDIVQLENIYKVN